jgi:hypothetical protein
MFGHKKTVIVTGSSGGGVREPFKMAGIISRGIETLTLDVLSEVSTAACVEKI